jgi:hypothetical protein
MARWYISYAAYDHERLFRVTTPEPTTTIQRFVAVGYVSHVLAPLYTNRPLSSEDETSSRLLSGHFRR